MKKTQQTIPRYGREYSTLQSNLKQIQDANEDWLNEKSTPMEGMKPS